MKNKDHHSKEQKFSLQRKSKDGPIHLKEAPDPRGRDGLQIDPDDEV
jgi:hypothetical protein